jgi:hypothetical protein
VGRSCWARADLQTQQQQPCCWTDLLDGRLRDWRNEARRRWRVFEEVCRSSRGGGGEGDEEDGAEAAP